VPAARDEKRVTQSKVGDPYLDVIESAHRRQRDGLTFDLEWWKAALAAVANIWVGFWLVVLAADWLHEWLT
jgi:hypothetical protein